jgi:hypothetical protein
MAAGQTCKSCDRILTTQDSRGLCPAHYQRWRLADRARRQELCHVAGCDLASYARGWCPKHYERWRAYGDPEHEREYLSAGQTMEDGYRRLYRPNHPNACANGRVREHVMVMAAHIGRPIAPNETVHHKNGVRDDNRIENLELWASHHSHGQRITDLVAWAHEILEKYEALT